MKRARIVFCMFMIISNLLDAAQHDENKHAHLWTRRNAAIVVGVLGTTAIGAGVATYIYRSLIKTVPKKTEQPLDSKKESEGETSEQKKSGEKKELQGYSMSADSLALFNKDNIEVFLSADGKSLMLGQYEGNPYSGIPGDYRLENKLSVSQPIAVFQHAVNKGSHFFKTPYTGGASNAVRYLKAELKDQEHLRAKISQIIILTDEPLHAWDAKAWGEPEGFADNVKIIINPKVKKKSKSLFWDNPVERLGDYQVLIFVPSSK